MPCRGSCAIQDEGIRDDSRLSSGEMLLFWPPGDNRELPKTDCASTTYERADQLRAYRAHRFTRLCPSRRLVAPLQHLPVMALP